MKCVSRWPVSLKEPLINLSLYQDLQEGFCDLLLLERELADGIERELIGNISHLFGEFQTYRRSAQKHKKLIPA